MTEAATPDLTEALAGILAGLEVRSLTVDYPLETELLTGVRYGLLVRRGLVTYTLGAEGLVLDITEAGRDALRRFRGEAEAALPADQPSPPRAPSPAQLSGRGARVLALVAARGSVAVGDLLGPDTCVQIADVVALTRAGLLDSGTQGPDRILFRLTRAGLAALGARLSREALPDRDAALPEPEPDPDPLDGIPVQARGQVTPGALRALVALAEQYGVATGTPPARRSATVLRLLGESRCGRSDLRVLIRLGLAVSAGLVEPVAGLEATPLGLRVAARLGLGARSEADPSPEPEVARVLAVLRDEPTSPTADDLRVLADVSRRVLERADDLGLTAVSRTGGGPERWRLSAEGRRVAARLRETTRSAER